MTISLSQINIWAVLVAAVASFIVGGIWYAALFGNAWVRLHGYGEEQIKVMQQNQPRSFALFFVADLLTACVLSILVANLAAPTVGSAIGLALLIWLGIGVTNAIQHNAAHQKPMGAFLIDIGHHFFNLLVIAAIIGAWR